MFEIGDVVVLNSGSPDMTVTNTGERKGIPHVWCKWLNAQGKEESDIFPAAAVKRAPKKPPPVNRGPPGGTWGQSRTKGR